MKNLLAMLTQVLALLLAVTPLQAQENSGLRSDLSGVYTAAQAERGRQLYAVRCARCHDVGFSDAPPLAGARITGDFEGRTLFELEDLIHTSMPLDVPGSTPKPEATDLTAFILSAMQAPPGDTELPADDSVLRTIRINLAK